LIGRSTVYAAPPGGGGVVTDTDDACARDKLTMSPRL
jgi:hypothetical protein